MSIDKHVENRLWAFGALEDLQTFIEDPDFEGQAEEQKVFIQRKRTELKEGKYRVVFLGAFNVGKSTMINAFLGDEYLPTILEECTTKITHVVRGEDMRSVLRLSTAATEAEVDSLRSLIAASGIDASIYEDADSTDLIIAYEDPSSKAMLQSLKALTTVNADDDFPQLKTLREKFEELQVYVPNNRLEEDIALVDSPGVYTISETNKKIAQEIIPHSHLVIVLLDSQNAGNEHNRDFIERIVKHRHRKVFFVINKADQLNPEEVDLTGRRGPAKDLHRSLDGIVENPELFFVSSLYAMVAAQLSTERLSLDELDENNKIKIPFSVQRQMLESDSPEQAAADYLLEQSRFKDLRARLLNYLYNENREGAIVESVCRFIDSAGWKFARPLEVKLELVMNNPRLEELDRMIHRLTERRESNETQMREIQNTYERMTGGGEADGTRYEGYEGTVGVHLDKNRIARDIVKAVQDWIENDEKFSEAKRNGFKPLSDELDKKIKAFLNEVHAAVNGEVNRIEKRALDKMGSLRNDVTGAPNEPVEAAPASVGAFNVSLGSSYFGFGVVGALLLGAAGGGLGYAFVDRITQDGMILTTAIEATQQNGAMVGAAAGAVLGLLLGLVSRAATASKAVRQQLAKTIEEKVDAVLFKGSRDGVGRNIASVRAQLTDALAKRREAFGAAVKSAYDKLIASLNGEMDVLRTEADEIRTEQEEVRERLQPKIDKLHDISKEARRIAEFNAREDGAARKPVEEEAGVVPAE